MSQSLAIQVLVNAIEKNPHCFHGPTLLFRRLKSKKRNGFYACSASRDRRECPFYLDENSLSNNKQSSSAVERRKQCAELYRSRFKMKQELLEKKARDRCYCHTCQCLFLINDLEKHHNCNKALGLSKRLLSYPTEIVLPKENDKVEAQYLFSPETAEIIIQLLKGIGASRVLCIGTPTIHEQLLNRKEVGIKSLLLDIDPKYNNFYDDSQFLWYNMFNNFIMDEEHTSRLNEYLDTDEKVVVLLDPPFGGRVEPIAQTLQTINSDIRRLRKNNILSELPVMWFFPYFMERHIQDSLPNFRMFDYQVNYANHSSFSDKGSRKRKNGSPVRIFTNILLSHLDLTAVPGYHFCSNCKYWVSDCNSHCLKCNSCTSKNGSRYNHCDVCEKCVKSSYSHCEVCRRCCLPSHVCGQFQPDTTCYHCNKPGHKKSACPSILKKRKKKKYM